MPGKTRAVTTAMKLGMKYGPVAYEAVKHGRAPARVAAQRSLSKSGAKRQAIAHATSLVDGSTMRVFYGEMQIWVVFSGDKPVGTHPVVGVPIATLLQHADLNMRIHPRPLAPHRRIKKSRRSALKSSRAAAALPSARMPRGLAGRWRKPATEDAPKRLQAPRPLRPVTDPNLPADQTRREA